MSGWTLQEEKQALIGILAWYRDEWHHMDHGHTRMMEEVRAATDAAQLEHYWQVTDGWLDNDRGRE